MEVTELLPCVVPKFAPVIATALPTTPATGDKLAMLGGGGVTVRVVDPQMEPAHALIVAVPGASPSALP